MNLPRAGACDCHMHVFEDSYPLAPTATFKPPRAPASAYVEVQRALGLSRVVVVQPTGYGFDNRCTLGAMQEIELLRRLRHDLGRGDRQSEAEGEKKNQSLDHASPQGARDVSPTISR